MNRNLFTGLAKDTTDTLSEYQLKCCITSFECGIAAEKMRLQNFE